MTSQSPSQLVKSNHICDKNEGMRSTFLSQCDRRKQVSRQLPSAQNKTTTNQTLDAAIDHIVVTLSPHTIRTSTTKNSQMHTHQHRHKETRTKSGKNSVNTIIFIRYV